MTVPACDVHRLIGTPPAESEAPAIPGASNARQIDTTPAATASPRVTSGRRSDQLVEVHYVLLRDVLRRRFERRNGRPRFALPPRGYRETRRQSTGLRS